ncbi:MAG: prepilin-type N-terminal cleavage/methylation domain-containing protein [Gammaproteobacteria bacterium]|nr:prepilin-type N-terminal cleavage/methylation domain-containing protein [Gammaproteobacteria bacterium]
MSINNRMQLENNNTGFTLIEMMIAMVLLSLIMLMLFSSLFSANKHWQIGMHSADKNNEVRLSVGVIEKYLSQATPLIWIDKKEQSILFSGKQNELAFSTRLPAHRGGGGFYFVKLHITESETNSSLNMDYFLIQPDSPPLKNEKAADSVELVADVDTLVFSYFGRKKPGQKEDWFEEWESKTSLPRLVRIQIRTSAPDNIWPQIDIPLRNTSVKRPEYVIAAM